jgi:cytosine/adenosine deaminase-related metal-dependent hydrolase
MPLTVIEQTSWVVAWDQARARHVYLRDCDVAFCESGFIYVGPRFEGNAQNRMCGRGRMLMPGFVDIHSHPTTEPLRRGITDETTSPGFHHSSLYEFLPVLEGDEAGRAACIKVALAELLKSGVTTLVDLSIPYEGWLDALADSGIRACIAPMYRDARWSTPNGHSIDYEWDAARGRASFDNAARLIELARQHPSGRLTGMLCPAQIDTCTAELLRDSHDLAVQRRLQLQIHVAQSVAEFHEIFRRHGKTPVQWLDALSVLDGETILGHAIFLDHHPWLHWTSRRDLDLIAERGASVAHCPTVFVRRGITLRTFGAYLRAGVNVGIGTDTYPHDFLRELFVASYAARVIGESVTDHTAAELFTAATVGGARAMKRDDLGRITVGAKADFLLIDLDHPAMRPVYDPVRTLIYSADDRAIRDVWIDGRCVVADGVVTTIDTESATAALEEAQAKMLEKVPERDWAGRPIERLAPRCFELG